MDGVEVDEEHAWVRGEKDLQSQGQHQHATQGLGCEDSNVAFKETTNIVIEGSKQHSRTGNKSQKWKKLVRNQGAS